MMNMQLTMFLASAAGAFIGGALGSAIVTRWQTDRIHELEDHLLIVQKALTRLLREARGA